MANLRPYRRNSLIFNDGFSEMQNMIDSFFNEARPRSLENSSFKVDIADQGDSYLVEAEMPGFEKEEINIKVEDDTITISASKEESIEEKDEETNYIHRERRSSTMSRTMSFVDMDTEKLEASLDKGVLSIKVGKKDQDSGIKTLEIQ